MAFSVGSARVPIAPARHPKRLETMSPDPPRLIMHLDMDAFYAAVEQRDDPALCGRAVVVGAQPGGRGVVATCSYEARRFGIRSAMPINEAYRRCPDAVFLRPRMTHYRAVSREVRAVLGRLVPLVEPISIDEAYLDVTGLERLIGPPRDIGQHLKDAIRAAVGLTASVGIGPNRLVAKIASDAEKPDGLVVIQPDEVAGFLGPLPVGVLRGVGSRTLVRLERLGIHTVADLRARSPAELQRHLGSRAAVGLHQQAHGIASDQVGERAPRKSLSRETTFGRDILDPRILRQTLRELADGGSRRRAAGGHRRRKRDPQDPLQRIRDPYPAPPARTSERRCPHPGRDRLVAVRDRAVDGPARAPDRPGNRRSGTARAGATGSFRKCEPMCTPPTAPEHASSPPPSIESGRASARRHCFGAGSVRTKCRMIRDSFAADYPQSL
jgi:nucleotidyltransferase/DNA polymerase involved in DNA repair